MHQPSALPTQWVTAAPFRYHLQHLIAATGVPWQVIAIVAQLSQQQVRTLLFGRDGRRPRRISPYAARRLIAVTRDQLDSLRRHLVSADLVQDNVTALLDDGLPIQALAGWLSLDQTALSRLAAGSGTCSMVTCAMVRLACVERGLLHETESMTAA